MPHGVVKTAQDEKDWSTAKKRAAEEGRAKDYAYIMGIYKNIKRNRKKKKGGS